MVPAGNEQAKATHYGKRRPGYGTEYGAVPTAEEIVNSLDNKGIGDLQFSVEELESILDERDLTNLRVLAESIVKAMIDTPAAITRQYEAQRYYLAARYAHERALATARVEIRNRTFREGKKLTENEIKDLAELEADSTKIDLITAEIGLNAAKADLNIATEIGRGLNTVSTIERDILRTTDYSAIQARSTLNESARHANKNS